MPFKRSTFAKWEVVEADPHVVVQHQETGEQTTLKEGGGIKTPSLDTGQFYTESRGATVVVHVNDGALVADGPDSEIASGDIDTPSDVTAVLQAALDEGGHVVVRHHSSDYVMGVGGTDKEGSEYCLSIPSDTDLEIKPGATLRYPASGYEDSNDAPVDVATPLLIEGVSNVRVRGNGTVDGGVHLDDGEVQDGSSGSLYNQMGIKIGARDTAATASYDVEIHDITLTGAWRHAIEASGPKEAGSERGLIKGVTFDDGSGDDDVSISVGTKYWTVRDCWSINKTRQGFWTGASFEAEDGAEHVVFDNLYSIGCAYNGITLGKSHAPDNPCLNHRATGCTVINCGGNAYVMTPSGDEQTTESIHFIDCEARNVGAFNATQGAVHVAGEGDHTIKDVTVDVDVYGSDSKGLTVALDGGTFIDWDVKLTTRDITDFGILLRVLSGSEVYDGVHFVDCDLEADKDLIRIKGDTSNFDGCAIMDNKMWDGNSGWDDIGFQDNDNAREGIKTLHNGTADDVSSHRLKNPDHGERMFADASLRSVAYDGYDYYDADNSMWRELS